MKVILWFILMSTIFSQSAIAKQLTVFKCDFAGLKFYITVEDKSLSTRVGTSIGIGNYAQAYFDDLHKIWIIVESIAGGTLPSTLTTVKPDGGAVHSRHTIFDSNKVMHSQSTGTCIKI